MIGESVEAPTAGARRFTRMPVRHAELLSRSLKRIELEYRYRTGSYRLLKSSSRTFTHDACVTSWLRAANEMAAFVA